MLVKARTFGADPAGVWEVASYRAAVWVRDHTSSDDVFAMKDAGTFGYFSRRSVVNMDGVVNNAAYQDSIDAGAVGGYLRASGVRYVAQHDILTEDEHLLPEVSGGRQSVQSGDYDRVSFRYHSMRSGKHGEPIVLSRDTEVYRAEYGALGEKSFVIWRYQP